MEALVYELNREGAQLARAAADRGRRRGRPAALRCRRARPDQSHRLASRPMSTNPGFRAITFDELREAYASRRSADRGRRRSSSDRDHLRYAQRQGGDFAIDEVFEARGVALPVMISGTITDRSGRTLSGQTPEASGIRCAMRAPFSIGLNCALGAEEMRAHIAEICARRRYHARVRLSQCRPAQRVRRL